jgi:hypothetical protein
MPGQETCALWRSVTRRLAAQTRRDQRIAAAAVVVRH